MNPRHDAARFPGGAFLLDAAPHLLAGARRSTDGATLPGPDHAPPR